MSISVGIPAIGNVTADASNLNGVSGPLLTDPNSQPPPLPPLPTPSSLSIQALAAPVSNAGSLSIDPLTPRGLTTGGAAALTSVINTVTATLNSIQANTTAGFSQLLQSPAFQLLLQIIGAGTAETTTSVAQLESLLTAVEASVASTGSTSTATISNASAATSVSTQPIAHVTQSNTAQSSNGSTNTPSNIEKLLGELQSTYQATSPEPGQRSSSNASELDLFLKWLSVNGTGSVVASA